VRIPVLHTERLHLEPFRLAHAPLLHRITGDPEVFWWGADETVGETRARLEALLARDLPDGLGSWLLFDRSSGDVVGDVVLVPVPRPTGEIEAGWHLARAHWGKGYATEAARRAVAHAFDTLRLDEVVSDIAVTNTRSQAVARRLGMAPRPPQIERLGIVHDVWRLSLPAPT
jgi:RimJ/RimL family protein N-acetyltransferase